MDKYPHPPEYYKLFRLWDGQGECPIPPPAPPRRGKDIEDMFGATVHDPTSVAPPLPPGLLIPEVACKDLSGRDGGAAVQSELKALNRSALLNYGHLLSACLDNTDTGHASTQTQTALGSKAREEKVSDVASLHLNMFHVLNGYRVHEGRECLVAHQEDCAKRRRVTVDTLHNAHTHALDIVQRAAAITANPQVEGEGVSAGHGGAEICGDGAVACKIKSNSVPPAGRAGGKTLVKAARALQCNQPDSALLADLNGM